MDATGPNDWKSQAADWLSGVVFLAVGVANLLMVHPVPALAYGLVSLVYIPPARAVVKRRLGFSVHPVVRIALAVAVVMFTLGVSDLGDTID